MDIYCVYMETLFQSYGKAFSPQLFFFFSSKNSLVQLNTAAVNVITIDSVYRLNNPLHRPHIANAGANFLHACRDN